jgi:hypothetical protein
MVVCFRVGRIRNCHFLLRKSRVVYLPAGCRTNPRGEVPKPRRVRMIAVNRQLVQSDAVITADGIPALVLREAARDARLRQPLRVLAGLFFGNRSYHCIAATHARSREPAPAKKQKPPAREPRHRRTGRNVQFNLKVRQEALDAFYEIADLENWVLGETFEKAVAALKRELAAKPTSKS